jgi:hypothetical protein
VPKVIRLEKRTAVLQNRLSHLNDETFDNTSRNVGPAVVIRTIASTALRDYTQKKGCHRASSTGIAIVSHLPIALLDVGSARA